MEHSLSERKTEKKFSVFLAEATRVLVVICHASYHFKLNSINGSLFVIKHGSNILLISNGYGRGNSPEAYLIAAYKMASPPYEGTYRNTRGDQ